MSIKKDVRVTCSHCRKIFFSQAWTYVNADTETWLKEKILSGETIQHRCPQCRKITWKEVEFLYYDPHKEFVIFLQNENLLLVDDETVKIKIGNLPWTSPAYQFRHVARHKDLAEKISIFDHNLNDFTIELLKELLVLEYLSKGEKRKLPDEVRFINAMVKPSGLELKFVIKTGSRSQYIFAQGGDYEYVNNLIKEYPLPEFSKKGWKSVGQGFIMNFTINMLEEQIRRNRYTIFSREEFLRRVKLISIELKQNNPAAAAFLAAARPQYTQTSIILVYSSDVLTKRAKKYSSSYLSAFKKYFGEGTIITFVTRKS